MQQWHEKSQNSAGIGTCKWQCGQQDDLLPLHYFTHLRKTEAHCSVRMVIWWLWAPTRLRYTVPSLLELLQARSHRYLWLEAEFKEEDDQMQMRIESGVTGEISTHAKPPWLTPRSRANVFTRSHYIMFKMFWRLERPLTNEERQILCPFSKRYNGVIKETSGSSVSL